MALGGICGDLKIRLVIIQGNISAQMYRDDVWRPVVRPFIQQPHGIVFQHDNSRKWTLIFAIVYMSSWHEPNWTYVGSSKRASQKATNTIRPVPFVNILSDVSSSHINGFLLTSSGIWRHRFSDVLWPASVHEVDIHAIKTVICDFAVTNKLLILGTISLITSIKLGREMKTSLKYGTK